MVHALSLSIIDFAMFERQTDQTIEKQTKPLRTVMQAASVHLLLVSDRTANESEKLKHTSYGVCTVSHCVPFTFIDENTSNFQNNYNRSVSELQVCQIFAEINIKFRIRIFSSNK